MTCDLNFTFAIGLKSLNSIFPYSILIGHTASRDLAYRKNATRLDLIQTDPPATTAHSAAQPATSILTQNSSQAAAFFRFGTETKNIEHHHVARRRQKWVEINSEVVTN
jgi:hypothetical protein